MQWRWSPLVIVALAVRIAQAQETNAFTLEVRALLAQRSARTGIPERLIEREALEGVYRSPQSRPLWSVDSGGPTRPTRQALALIDVLAASDTRGLPSDDYDVQGVRTLAAAASGSRADAARFDVALSRSVVRFLANLHLGRVDPSIVRWDLPNAHGRLDLAALVTGVARAADVPAAVTAAEPPYAAYAALTRTLARYRELAADTALRPPRRAAGTIRPGARYADVPALARLLRALGDLDSTPGAVDQPVVRDSTNGPTYAGGLVDAVVRFQRRHGLDPDSAIGPATMTQLRIPLARRVRQIELTLERWRWLPDQPPDRYVVVNIPGFRLYAFQHDSAARRPLLTMKVIVGEARGRHDTPVFTAIMREVVFRPYWDVPPRIARIELIPIFRQRPAYFDSEGFEIVRRTAADTDAITFPPTEHNLARVVAGELRLRQRPGPLNALGAVKFLFPNRYNVYLHGTPAQELFAHTRRDFSHGCIRIEQPTALAELVLAGQPPWDREAMEAAMTGSSTVHVPITRPLGVYVVYATAAVDNDGVVSFYADLYGHDADLERTLGLPPVADRPTPP